MDEIVFQEGCGMLYAELILQQQAYLNDMSAQKIASYKPCRRHRWQAIGKLLLGAHHLFYPGMAAVASVDSAEAVLSDCMHCKNSRA